MGRALLSLSVLCAACAARPDPGEPSLEELFDGRDLSGWEGDPRFWRVEEGAIVGESTAGIPCAETTYLVWRGYELSDFELELEWRFPAQAVGANSGVQFRSRAESCTAVTGYQADLETGPDWTGGLYEQGGRGIVTRRGERVVLGTDGAKTVERFADGAELLARLDASGWNRLRVTAFGPRLTLEVNDELFSETIDLDPARAARRGTLALQLHQGPPMRVEFRALRLRRLGGAPGSTPAAGPRPEWIWPPVAVADEQTAWFRRSFELARAPVGAELWISGDNHFDAWLGGQGVATSDDWTRALRVDVTPWLRAGENELLVRCENDEREAGLIVRLTVELEGGARFTLASDTSFEACLQGAEELAGDALARWLDDGARWQPAQSFGALGVAPWGALGEDVVASGEAPEAAAIHVPAGFTVERLYSVPLATQGSWVSLAVDPRGRFYAGDQYGGVFRIEVPPLGSSGETRVTPLPIALGEAHGLLWAFDALYAVVSGAGEFESGLYRARDTDGDDELDRVELLRHFDGDGEHGPHAVVLDADGASLLVVAGNFTGLPEPLACYRRPENWAEDALLWPLDDPNGHAVGITAPGGWVARTDPEGKSWELVAAGLRNAYDLAVSADGEVFTYDSDMEWDLGLPWYKPTRVLHVVSGGEYGWRAGSKNWPADSFDALPSAVDLGLGSPTGLAFGTRTSFPAPWKDALFACDWAYGRVFAVHLEPAGASYRGSHEVFASGEPLPVTDVVAGGDGALYLTIGGRQTQSGLYRIAWSGSAPEREEPRADRSAELQRQRRRALERGHGAGARERTEDERAQQILEAAAVFSELGDRDRFIRHAARIRLEGMDPDLWAGLVHEERDPRRALEGWLALVHCDPSTEVHEVVERALEIFTTSSERADRIDALRLLELVLLRRGARDERPHIRTTLDPAYPSGDTRLDRALLDLLVYLDADVAGRAFARLELADTQEERIAILNAWRALDVYFEESTVIPFMHALEREIEGASGGLSVRGYLEAMRSEVFGRTALGAASSPEHEPVPAVTTAARRPARLHSWTSAELEPRLAEVARARSFERGRAAYQAASCAQCHRLSGEGANLGPDLTGCAGRFSARDLLVAILDPSREVPDVWRDLELWSAEEEGIELLAAGRLESEREGELVVLEPSGARVRVPAASVAERLPHRLSRMPEGLLDTLAADEILDLLAYVLSGGERGDERFQREAEQGPSSQR